MASGTSSRAVWPTSKFAYTQPYSPVALSVSARALSVEVLPVWRGAWRTKYFLLRIKCRISSRSTRSNGGMQ